MEKKSKIYLAGHTGLVGSGMLERLKDEGFSNIITRTHKELDLLRQADVEAFFDKERPEYVILCAAKVGGICANKTYPAEFIYENLVMQNNVIHCSHVSEVKKLLFLASACSYPRECRQPMKEEYLLTGRLEPTNEPYAVAKIAGMKLCESYKRQYKRDFITALPTNAYGPNDNFDAETSHVIPALIKKMHEAGLKGLSEVLIWGSGDPLREFIYVDDLADACLFLMRRSSAPSSINIGSGEEITVRDLVFLVKDVVGFNGSVTFDASRPDGALRKLLDSSRLSGLGWRGKTTLADGVRKTYDWYLRNIAHGQGLKARI